MGGCGGGGDGGGDGKALGVSKGLSAAGGEGRDVATRQGG